MNFQEKLDNLKKKVNRMHKIKIVSLSLILALTIAFDTGTLIIAAKAVEKENNNDIDIIDTVNPVDNINTVPVSFIDNKLVFLSANTSMDIASSIPLISMSLYPSINFQSMINPLDQYKKEEPDEPKDTTYVVQPGDNLWSISNMFYGNGSDFYTIKNANQGIAITAGSTITIPANPIPIETTTIPKLTSHTDLCAPINITVEQMNTFIDGFGNSASAFSGHGDIFIEAYAITGYNPLYLFGHAVLESSWGKGDLAKYKGNYFGIGAYDSDPYNCAYTMATSDGSNDSLMRDGIINGAIWIKENWYDRGLTTLNSMIYGTKYPYASAGDHWINSIVSLANQKLKLINN